jgi:sulfatase modifying factor 1
MRRLLAALGLMLGAICSTAISADEPRSDRTCAIAGRNDEVFIPAGFYYPFFKSGPTPRVVPVEPICLRAAPVTHAEFLGFVRDHPEWRRTRIKRLFAEDTYLTDWRDDLTPPPEALSQPVTFVSWFAAGAYCEAEGGRLPTVAEWERVAGSNPQAKTSGGDRAADAAAPFGFAMGRKNPELARTPLVFPGVWEWTANFNSALVSGRIGTDESADSSLFCGDGFRAVDASNYAAFLRYSFRSSLRADFALKNLGFRCASEPEDSSKLSERSIYQLDSSWTEDDGHAFRLRELTGEVQLLAMIYTTCTGSCPVIVKALQMLSRNLPADLRAHTRFVLVTVDPERDTVAALRAYRREMNLAGERWKLLRGSPADVRELAAVLGFNYEQIESGEFVHTNLVTVLDPRGQIVHQQNDFAGDSEGLIEAIRQALSADSAQAR